MRLVDAHWEDELRKGIAACHGTLHFACPFIKEPVISRLLAAADLNTISVVTRFCLPDFARGVSDIAALRVLMDAGADVRGLRGLHAKVFVFDDQLAVVTSANLTETGLTRNAEFGCVSEDAAFVASCKAYVKQLHANAASVSREQLADWDEIVTSCLRSRGGQDPIDGLPDLGASGSAGSGPASNAPAIDSGREGWTAESRRAFVKFAGRGNDRAELSDAVLDEIDGSGAFKFCTYPAGGGHPRRIKDGDTIFLSRMTHSPNDMRIVGRGIAIAHNDRQDMASSEEIKIRPWLVDWPYLVRVHHCEFIGGQLGDGASLNDLIETLGPDSFRSTQERRQAGEQNVNTRQSLARKADVQLSAEGFTWLTSRFENALARHGKIPEKDIDRLA
jgi:HKD family nuclease